MRAVTVIVLTVLLCPANAQTPEQSIESVLRLQRDARATQLRIETISRQRQALLGEIETIESDGTTYALRNRDLEQQLATVQENLAEIDSDIHAVADIQTGIVTLLTGMIDALDRFIALDLPFELERRQAVITALRRDLVRADIDVGKKYQAIVSAYLDEIRFGHTDAVMTGRIATPAGERTVNILRLGRAGLWYVTPDGVTAGRWDRRTRGWTDADTDADEVMRGIRIVRNLTSPALIRLPVQADATLHVPGTNPAVE